MGAIGEFGNNYKNKNILTKSTTTYCDKYKNEHIN